MSRLRTATRAATRSSSNGLCRHCVPFLLGEAAGSASTAIRSTPTGEDPSRTRQMIPSPNAPNGVLKYRPPGPIGGACTHRPVRGWRPGLRSRHHARHDDRRRTRQRAHAGARTRRSSTAEREGWYEVERLIRSLTPAECLVPGYYDDPDWTVRDVVAHLGTWLAEAGQQLERMTAGTYAGHDVDIDGLNASFLAAMQGQPWDVAWPQASAARNRMLLAWAGLPGPDDESAW